MRLATRLVAVTAGTVFLASGLAGGVLTRLERGQLIADELAESRLLARSLQVAVEHALRDGQEPDIAELLGRIERIEAELDVLVYAAGEATPRFASYGADLADPGAEALRQQADADEVLTWAASKDGPSRLLMAIPLFDEAGGAVGTLVMSRPSTSLEADLRATSAFVAVSVLAFAAATTAVMMGLLRSEVTGPLSSMASAAAVLGDDLDARLDLPVARSDELAAMGRTLVRLQAALVAARDRALAESGRREDLERRLRDADKLIAVGQLAAGVAHEVGSPLQVLVGRAHLLADDPANDEEVRRQAQLIADHAVRISGIVGRLQDLARRTPPTLRDVDLREPVNKVVWLLAPEARRRGVTLAFEPPPRPVVVRADDGEVQQVVLNLALNALQACVGGGDVRVRVEARDDGGALVVTDSGAGMDAEVLGRAVEAFYTTRAEQGGTGLGLAVVRSVADRHGARLSLDSAPGVGTTATVIWPRGVE